MPKTQPKRGRPRRHPIVPGCEQCDRNSRPHEPCRACGKVFHVRRGQTSCSISCSQLSRLRETELPICPGCGEKFRPGGGRPQRACSQICASTVDSETPEPDQDHPLTRELEGVLGTAYGVAARTPGDVVTPARRAKEREGLPSSVVDALLTAARSRKS